MTRKIDKIPYCRNRVFELKGEGLSNQQIADTIFDEFDERFSNETIRQITLEGNISDVDEGNIKFYLLRLDDIIDFVRKDISHKNGLLLKQTFNKLRMALAKESEVPDIKDEMARFRLAFADLIDIIDGVVAHNWNKQDVEEKYSEWRQKIEDLESEIWQNIRG